MVPHASCHPWEVTRARLADAQGCGLVLNGMLTPTTVTPAQCVTAGGSCHQDMAQLLYPSPPSSAQPEQMQWEEDHLHGERKHPQKPAQDSVFGK